MTRSSQPWAQQGKNISSNELWCRSKQLVESTVVQINDGGLGMSCGSGDGEKRVHLGYALERSLWE